MVPRATKDSSKQRGESRKIGGVMEKEKKSLVQCHRTLVFQEVLHYPPYKKNGCVILPFNSSIVLEPYGV